MRQFINIILLVIAALSVGSCSNDGPGYSERPKKERKDIILTRSEQEMVDSHAKFAFDFFKELNLQNSKESNIESLKNILVSPLGVTIDLSILANAVDDESYGEFLKLMDLDPSTSRSEMNSLCKRLVNELLAADSQVDLKFANAIWTLPQYEISRQFADEVIDKYEAFIDYIELQDSKSEEIIDGWARDATSGLITDIHKVDPMKIIVSKICNAIYFNGEWTDKFNRDQTVTNDFNNIDGTVSRVSMMRGESLTYNVNDDNRSVISVPFGNQAYSMYFILPDEDQEFEQSIAELDYDKWLQYKQSFRNNTVKMVIPRLDIDYKFDLMGTLGNMGLNKIKDGDVSLSNMFVSPPDIDFILASQSCAMKLEENGVKTSVTTVVEPGVYIAPSPVEEIILDRPFMFLIEEKSTGAILFMGKVVKL